jgi:hypothetical protein
MSRQAANLLRYPPVVDFVLLCSPTAIDFVNGEPLPRLDRVPIDPGLLGVPGVRRETDEVRWSGAVALECHNTGRILIDPARYGLIPKLTPCFKFND